MSNPHRRRLSNFLIDSTYQLRHALALILICAVILIIMGIYWYQEMAVAGEVVEVGVVSTMRQGDALRLMEQLVNQRQTRLAVMLGGSVLLCLVVGGFVIVLTHTVAGPLHVIRRRISKIASGRLDGELRPLRSGDGVIEFHQTFKEMVQRLQEDAAAELELVDAAIVKLEALHPDAASDEEQGEAARLLADLRQLRQRKAEQLDLKINLGQ